jgi:hypothetical protein
MRRDHKMRARGYGVQVARPGRKKTERVVAKFSRSTSAVPLIHGNWRTCRVGMTRSGPRRSASFPNCARHGGWRNLLLP